MASKRYVYYEEIAEIICEAEGFQVFAGDAGGYYVVGLVVLEILEGPAYRRQVAEGANLYKAESQVVKVVVKVSFNVQSGAQAYGIVEIDPEDFLFQSCGAVAVYDAVKETASGYHAFELEPALCYCTGFLVVLDSAGDWSDQEAVHSAVILKLTNITILL